MTSASSTPHRSLAIVACMDERLDPISALGVDQSSAHVIRNAGGVVTEDVIRSLCISQCLLGTREISLVRHTDCGMLRLGEEAMKDAIEREAGARPPFALEAFSDLESGVRESIAQLQASPFVPHTDAIRGFVYEVETGRLREVA